MNLVDFAALHAAATPPPWEAHDTSAYVDCPKDDLYHTVGRIDRPADRRLIVAMRNALPELRTVTPSQQLEKAAMSRVLYALAKAVRSPTQASALLALVDYAKADRLCEIELGTDHDDPLFQALNDGLTAAAVHGGTTP